MPLPGGGKDLISVGLSRTGAARDQEHDMATSQPGTDTTSQADIDWMNQEFWNELCGTGFAKYLGITDHSPESLRRFDEGFFNLYPYFLGVVRPERMAGRDVLEIGLGYGTLGQRIAEAGARYVGLDIAPNPVRMMNLRLRSQGLSGTAVVGSALDMPFAAGSFDFVVSIGCMHHTGNVPRCFEETYRVLRPGGTAILMLYNKFGFRQWRNYPVRTFKELLSAWGLRRGEDKLTEEQRFNYDHNGAGAAAPETVLVGKREVRKMLNHFERVSICKQNADPLTFMGRLLVRRERLLGNLGRILGLDLYIEARKAGTLAPVGAISEARRPMAG
jgi:SAM-dependent methyltransferase